MHDRSGPLEHPEGFMGIIVGIVVGLLAALLGRVAGFDRDRAFYPTLLIIVASYYVLFAAMGGSRHALVVESAVMVVFVAAAVAAFRGRLWIAAAGLVGHGLFDVLVHEHVIDNPGMPAWWPPFCAAFDVVAGVFLAWLLARAKSA
jgi:hypothetical protein